MIILKPSRAKTVLRKLGHTLNDRDQINGLDDELKEIHGIKLIAYWYHCSGYDGSGWAIYLCTNGLWAATNLGHCSCYGPTEAISANEARWSSIEKLLSDHSEQCQEEFAPLIELIAQVAK